MEIHPNHRDHGLGYGYFLITQKHKFPRPVVISERNLEYLYVFQQIIQKARNFLDTEGRKVIQLFWNADVCIPGINAPGIFFKFFRLLICTKPSANPRPENRIKDYAFQP